jgi:hypothetical protein
MYGKLDSWTVRSVFFLAVLVTVLEKLTVIMGRRSV